MLIPLTPDIVLNAYSCGIFPMAENHTDTDVFWVNPKMRGIIPLDNFHIPRSLSKKIRSGQYMISVNRNFRHVISACAMINSDRPESWINESIIDVYCQLQDIGHAHSVECWLDDDLVGGLYGVSIGAAFFGESMFSKKTNASKVALVYLIERLINSGFFLLDTQFVTPHLKTFGAIEITRERYIEKLNIAIQRNAEFCSSNYPPICGAAPELWTTQLRTHIS